MKKELTIALNCKLIKLILCLWHTKQSPSASVTKGYALEIVSPESGYAAREQSLCSVTTEDVATFPFLEDVELGEGNTN